MNNLICSFEVFLLSLVLGLLTMVVFTMWHLTQKMTEEEGHE